MEKTKTTIKKNHTLYSIFGIIGDIIFYPVIIISLLSTCLMFFSKQQGKVPQLFGVSLVRVLSGSMEASNFQKGHNVFVQKTDSDDLKAGDIIAFFYYQDVADNGITKTSVAKINDYDNRESFVKTDGFSVPNRKKADDLDTKDVKVYFHQIIEIFYDDAGTSFFKTKGTSNSSADGYLIREDFVVGRYVHTPVWLRNVFYFCTTALGMILLVITPLSILIMIQSLSIIEQINNIILERKIIERRENWNTEDAYKANIGIEMDVPLKIYFYAIMPEQERPAVWNFLWSYLGTLNSKKAQHLYLLAKQSVDILSVDVEKYFDFWRDNLTSRRDLKKLEKVESRYRIDFSLSQIKKSQNEEKKVL